jgi:hexosaminidase
MEGGGSTSNPILKSAFERYTALITQGFACGEDMSDKITRLKQSLASRSAPLKVEKAVDPKKSPLSSSVETSSVAGTAYAAVNTLSETLSECVVSVEDEALVLLGEGTDESHTLTIDTKGSCMLTAVNTFGAIRGLETLSHLAGEACSITNAPVEITDSPRFGYRGLMLDSSRHFLPVATLKKAIDTMAALKLNGEDGRCARGEGGGCFSLSMWVGWG